MSFLRLVSLFVSVAACAVPYYNNGTASSSGTGYGSGSATITSAPSSTSEIDSTTYLTQTVTSRVTATRNSTGTGCTINALVDLIYWDTVVYEWVVTVCPTSDSRGSLSPPTVTEQPTARGVGSHGVAATRTIAFAQPAPSIVSEDDELIRETYPLSTATDIATYEAFTFVRTSVDFLRQTAGATPYSTLSPTTSIDIASTVTQYRTQTSRVLTYTSRSVSLTTPFWPGPTDVLRPNVTYNGDVYDYILNNKTAYVYASVFEVVRANATSTVTLSVPQLAEYQGDARRDWDGRTQTDGPLPATIVDDLQYFGVTSVSDCVAGTYQGAPTLEVALSTATRCTLVSPSREQETIAGLEGVPEMPAAGERPAAAPIEPAPPAPVPASPQTSIAGLEGVSERPSEVPSGEGPVITEGPAAIPFLNPARPQESENNPAPGPNPQANGNEPVPASQSQPQEQPPAGSQPQVEGQPETQGGSQSGGQPESLPGSQPGDQPENQPGSQPGAQPESQTGGEPGSQPGSQSDNPPESQPGRQPGSQPESQPESQPGSQPGGQPESQPGGQSESQTGGQPESQPGTQPGASPQDQTSPAGSPSPESPNPQNQPPSTPGDDTSPQSFLPPGLAPAPVQTTLLVGNIPVVVSSNNVILPSTTFNPTVGASPITATISNTPIVVNPSQIVAAGTTVALPSFAVPEVQLPVPSPVITVGSQAYTINSVSQLVLSGQTLLPGASAIIVGSQTLSLAPSATAIVVGTSTYPLDLSTALVSAPPNGAEAVSTGAPVLTFGSQVYTANSASEFVIGSQTITPGGPAVTISGTPVSVEPEATQAVVGGSTEGLGGAIWSAFGGSGPTSTAGGSNGGGAGPTNATSSVIGFVPGSWSTRAVEVSPRRGFVIGLAGIGLGYWMVI